MLPIVMRAIFIERAIRVTVLPSYYNYNYYTIGSRGAHEYCTHRPTIGWHNFVGPEIRAASRF